MKKHFVIPLRRDSMSIPAKNIKKLGGKHLFRWSLDEILKANISNEDSIWIATNISEIQYIINKYYSKDKVSIFWRSESSATFCSPTFEVVKELIEMEQLDIEDWIVLVQATSPFTSKIDLNVVIQKIDGRKYDSLISCTRLRKFRWSEDGQPLDYDWNSKPIRQNYKGFLIETGAFYASKVGSIINSKTLISGSVGVIEQGEESLFDIDEPIDWFLADKYVEFKKKY